MFGIEMDSQGIMPEPLRYTLNHWKDRVTESRKVKTVGAPKLLYVIPTGQNPTGTVTQLQRKKEIYKIAQEFDLLIVEDDPYFYIQYTEELVPSYQSIDTDGRVIRIDSMSKFLAPGFRLSWLTGPAAIVRRIQQAQVSSCGFPGGFAQLAAIKLFDRWGLEGIAKRIEFLRNFYKPLREEAEKAVRKHLSDIAEWHPLQAGFFVWLKLKSGFNTSALVDMELFNKHKIFAVPGVDFATSGETSPYIRIAFSCIHPQQFEEGVIRLAALIKEAEQS